VLVRCLSLINGLNNITDAKNVKINRYALICWSCWIIADGPKKEVKEDEGVEPDAPELFEWPEDI